MKSTIVFGDSHVPFEDVRAINAVLNFVVDFQPDYFIHIGDFFDFPQFSRHAAHDVHIRRIMEDDEGAGNRLLDVICSARKPDIIFEGNHDRHPERWLMNYAAQFAKRDGSTYAVTVPDLLRLEERGIRWVDIDEQTERPVFLGPVNFHHGYATGANAAGAGLNSNSVPQVFGHIHKHLVAQGRRFGKKQLTAMSIGCTCDLAPAWKRGRTSDWHHGCGSVFWDETDPTCPIEMNGHYIIDGALSVMGKKYVG